RPHSERSYHPKMRLVLASASPRRAELLRAAGYQFDTLAVDLDEGVKAGETPEAYVARLAHEKSGAALQRFAARAQQACHGTDRLRQGYGESRRSEAKAERDAIHDIVVLG